MCEDPVSRIYGIKTGFTGGKFGGFIRLLFHGANDVHYKSLDGTGKE